jgi:transcriptional regulator with XRE-family HTH domain
LKSVHTDEYQIFLDCLISARKSADITQQELAQRFGKPQSFVSKYENGERRLDVVEFPHVARAIGISPSDLLQEIETKTLSAGTREVP